MTIAPILVLFAGCLASPGDTLLEVREGDRLVVPDFMGTVRVEGWDRSEVWAQEEDDDPASILLRRVANRIEVRLGEGLRGNAEVRIRVPTWMDLEVFGREWEGEIRNSHGTVTLRNLEGDLVLRDLRGDVEAHSSEGTIEAAELSGNARLRTGDDDLRVSSSSATLQLETVDGDILLDDLDSPRIRVRTTDGDIEFSGRLRSQGGYTFSSHGGDISLHLAEPVNVDARILAYEGEFESDFRVQATGYRSGEALEFSLGGGGAALDVETYDGEIRLLRQWPTRDHPIEYDPGEP